MREGLGADAANPPGPSLWVADLVAMGCQVGFIYVWGPYTNYTPDHVEAAREAGIAVIPIVVPGNTPPPPPLYAAAWPYGITSGPIFYDVEQFSLPDPAWSLAAVAEAGAGGWIGGIYCTAARRAQYPSGLWWRAGTDWSGGGFSGVLPAPAADLSDYSSPAALQYDYEVEAPSGAHYDLSRVDLDVLAPVPVSVPALKPDPPAVPSWLEEEE